MVNFRDIDWDKMRATPGAVSRGDLVKLLDCLIELRDEKLAADDSRTVALWATNLLWRQLAWMAMDIEIRRCLAVRGAPLSLRPPGADVTISEIKSPRLRRAVLRTILECLFGLLPPQLSRELLEGLRRLDYGEGSDLLNREKTTKHGLALSAAELRLRALQWVEFMRARGMTQTAALEEVASRYRVSAGSTVSKWLPSVRAVLGDDLVDLALEEARRAGKSESDSSGISTWPLAQFGAELRRISTKKIVKR